MNKLFFVLLAIVFASCQSKNQSNRNAETNYELDSLTHKLQTIHDKGFINGFGVALVNQNGTVYSSGFGYSNIETSSAYTENSVQNIGSVSKTFIGISLLKAQDLNLLQLDDPISKYLPFEVKNPHFPDVPITIRQLATHTSSLLDTDVYDEKCYVLTDHVVVPDSVMDMSEIFNPPNTAISLINFLEKLLKKDGEWYQEEGFIKHKPGEIFEYSNLGSSLAAAVLEIATNKSFNQFATEHILKPLNMSSSGWSFDDIDLPDHSKLYIKPSIELPFYSLITYPDGGLLTSSADMAKYLTELINGYNGEGTLLSKEGYQEYFREQLQADNFLEERDDDFEFDEEYNSGIFIGHTYTGLIGHTGGDPGVATFMFFNPASKTGKFMMINTAVRGSDEAVAEFYDAWYTLDKYEKMLSSEDRNKH